MENEQCALCSCKVRLAASQREAWKACKSWRDCGVGKDAPFFISRKEIVLDTVISNVSLITNLITCAHFSKLQLFCVFSHAPDIELLMCETSL